MLVDLVAAGGNDKGGTGGDVEGVLAVTARTHDVEGIVVGKVDVATCFQQAVTETEELLHGDTACLHGHEESCQLAVVVALLGDTEENVVGVLAGERAALHELLEICFHISKMGE